MTDSMFFILGLIVGIGSMVLIILGWSLMNISSQISREEERLTLEETMVKIGEAFLPVMKDTVDDVLKLDMGEALNRPTWPPPDDDVKSS